MKKRKKQKIIIEKVEIHIHFANDDNKTALDYVAIVIQILVGIATIIGLVIAMLK